MSLLRLAVLGPPEVYHEGSRLTFGLRKAQALLLYLAVEGGLHPRSRLAALLWPDSEPQDARRALRNALALLRRLLADRDASAPAPSHLLSEQDLLGLDPQAPLALDLEVVQQAYRAAQRHSTLPCQEQRAALVSQLQHALALVRGPFLEGFWLREESGFDQWVQQQQQQWQVRLHLLFERLSSWQESGGELEPARVTLARWLALDPLSEAAYRRLMRVDLALGDASAALQVYATCRARLAEDLQVKPSAETVALAEHIRATAARRGSPAARPSTTAENQPPSALVAPLVGRQASFTQLVGRYQQARGGQPQAVLVVGEAGIGKTRLASEFVAWAQAQGAEVLSGQAFEMGGRLPYQPLVEALRTRLEAENAPEDLLDDVWLAELSRLLPELRGRYPDLPAPTQDELSAKGRLFEAVARLVDALARSAPLVLLLEDLQWVDGASLDLLRFLGRHWSRHGSRILLLLTLRREGLEPSSQLSAQLVDLGRDLPIRQVALQTLSQPETLQLLETILGEQEESTRRGGEPREHVPVRPSSAGPGAPPWPDQERPLLRLGEVLFAQTGGQPWYLLETLKLWRERQWLVPKLGADGTWKLEPTQDMAAVLTQDQPRCELVPPSVRALIQGRLAKLTPPARQLVMASAVLGTQVSAPRLWQLTEVGVQAGVEALEEAVKSGILCEEGAAGGLGVGRPGQYRFAHDLIREVVYTELGAARRQVLHQRALARLESEGARASELAYHARSSGEAEAASRYSVQAGDEAMAVFAVEEAIRHYQQARVLLHEHVQQFLPEPEIEHLYVSLGRAYAFLNAWQKAQEVYEELVAYAQHHQLPSVGSRTLNRLAILMVQQSKDRPQVQALLEEAWRLAQTSHDQKALAETQWNRAQILGLWGDAKRALPHAEQALSLARGIHDTELEANSLSMLGALHMWGEDFEGAIHCLEAALALYALLGNESTVSGALSLAHFSHGAPLTQPLTHRASEALCWATLAIAQVNGGQVLGSVRSGRRALALSKEIKNLWVELTSALGLTYGLLEAGAYEEALVLMQPTIALARTLPPTIVFHGCLSAMGIVYHALQQWEEARRSLAEAVAVAETIDLGPFLANALSQLCMNCAVAGEWQQAYRYAVKAIAVRKSHSVVANTLDFYSHYETEALLHEGDERQAREAVYRLGEHLGPHRRLRLPYLRSEALLSAWEGESEQAIDHLCEAAYLAADLGLPREQWQIQAALGRVYEAAGDAVQARTAFGEAATIIGGLAEGITDETRRARFLAGPPIQQVLQQAHRLATQVPHDQAKPSEAPRRLVRQTDELWEAS
jgi:DNA-binding SARP family transcriptional activator